MCIGNSEEAKLTVTGWSELFPDGVPSCYTSTDLMINIEALLPHIAKGKEKDFRQWATSKNAEIAASSDSFRKMKPFPSSE